MGVVGKEFKDLVGLLPSFEELVMEFKDAAQKQPQGLFFPKHGVNRLDWHHVERCRLNKLTKLLLANQKGLGYRAQCRVFFECFWRKAALIEVKQQCDDLVACVRSEKSSFDLCRSEINSVFDAIGYGEKCDDSHVHVEA